MKILQINKFFFLKGGAERYFFDLAELLTQKGHQVLVWSTQYSKNFPWPDKDSFAKYNNLSKGEGIWEDLIKARQIFWNRQAAKKLEKLISEKKPDIAHLHNIFGHLSPSIIYTLKKYNIPIVVTLHDYKMFCPNYQFFSQDKICFDCLQRKNFRSCFSKKCVKNSRIKSLVGYLEGKWQRDILKLTEKIDFFLAPSLYIKNKAIQAGVPVEKIVHLSHFVDVTSWEAKLSSKQIDSPKYILYSGRLSQEKGVGLLIKSYLENQFKLTKWELRIMGDGPDRQKLEKLAKGHKQIKFLGHKSGLELRQIISDAHLIVYPSLWPENSPYSIIEGQFLKKPVLAARIGGLPEMIKDQKTGLLFRPNDLIDLIRKINWVVNNLGKAKEIGRQAQKMVLDKYSPESHYQKLIKIYERIQNN